MLPRLWRYGLVLARNPETVEDLVQATCVRALEKSSQFEISTRRSFSMKASMVLSYFASCRSLVGSPSGKRSAGQTSTQSIGRAEITAFARRPSTGGDHGETSGLGPEPLCFVNQQLALRRKCPLWVSSRLSRHRSVSPLSAISGHWGGMGLEEDPLEVA